MLLSLNHFYSSKSSRADQVRSRVAQVLIEVDVIALANPFL